MFINTIVAPLSAGLIVMDALRLRDLSAFRSTDIRLGEGGFGLV